MFGGCTSCLVSGVIANWMDKNSTNLRAKSYISATMCLLAVPLCSLLFLVQSSFGFSVACLFLYDLLCLGYYAPVMSMIQATIEPENKGAAIGAFGFVNNYTQAFTSLIIGSIVTGYELDSDMRTFGTLCAICTVIPSFFAGLCFYRAGPEYEKIKNMQKEETENAIKKAEESEIELVDTNIE
jgi:MFS family permease